MNVSSNSLSFGLGRGSSCILPFICSAMSGIRRNSSSPEHDDNEPYEQAEIHKPAETKFEHVILLILLIFSPLLCNNNNIIMQRKWSRSCMPTIHCYYYFAKLAKNGSLKISC